MKIKYVVLQGIARKNSSGIIEPTYDLHDKGDYDTLEEATRLFEKIKHNSQGWVGGNVLITCVEKREYEENELDYDTNGDYWEYEEYDIKR